jgi:hypothetical protein
MKSMNLFLTAAVTTAALGAGMHLMCADGTPLAVSKQPITVDRAEVTGRIEGREDGVYGVISVTNRTDTPVEGRLNHASFCTPGSSMMSRMMPMPKLEHKGEYAFQLAPGEGARTQFRIQEVTPSEPVIADASQLAKYKQSAPTWSLVVSRSEIAKPVWGGMLLAPQAGIALPEEGQLVLAHCSFLAAPAPIVPAGEETETATSP